MDDVVVDESAVKADAAGAARLCVAEVAPIRMVRTGRITDLQIVLMPIEKAFALVIVVEVAGGLPLHPQDGILRFFSQP